MSANTSCWTNKLTYIQIWRGMHSETFDKPSDQSSKENYYCWTKVVWIVGQYLFHFSFGIVFSRSTVLCMEMSHNMSLQIYTRILMPCILWDQFQIRPDSRCHQIYQQDTYHWFRVFLFFVYELPLVQKFFCVCEWVSKSNRQQAVYSTAWTHRNMRLFSQG